MKALAVLAAGAFFYLQFLAPYAGPQIHVLEGATMGTRWRVQVVTTERQRVQEAGASIKELLAHLDRGVFSTWTPDSELSRLNRSQPNIAHGVSAEILDVLQLSQSIYERSHHAFDVSIGPLVNLWGFGPEPVAGIPDAAAIAQAQARVGFDALHIDDAAGTVSFARPLTLELAGIAEGYAVDRMADVLRALGFAAFLAEIGGEVRVQGRRPDGEDWVLAIEAPRDGARDAYATLVTRGDAIALSTSGDYRNFRDVDGERYAHGIDPRTGRPAVHALASVTVIGDTAAAADAWSTALMVLGPVEGRQVADSEGLAAYFIMRAPKGFDHAHTAAFARYLQQDPDPFQSPAAAIEQE